MWFAIWRSPAAFAGVAIHDATWLPALGGHAHAAVGQECTTVVHAYCFLMANATLRNHCGLISTKIKFVRADFRYCQEAFSTLYGQTVVENSSGTD